MVEKVRKKIVFSGYRKEIVVGCYHLHIKIRRHFCDLNNGVRSDHCDVSRWDGIFDQINENSGRALVDECDTPFFNTIRLTE